MATEAIGSALVLNIMLWLALLISIPLAGLHPIYVITALLGLLALFGAAGLVYGLTRGGERAVSVVRAVGRRIPRRCRPPGAPGHQVGDSVVALGRDRALLKRAVLWASLNWLLDAASLWSFVTAFGHFVDPVELFAAYGIANVLGAIPITPGGLGVIDVSAAALLVTFGVGSHVATLAVLGWRLVNFWLPIPIGGAAYISLRVPRARASGPAARRSPTWRPRRSIRARSPRPTPRRRRRPRREGRTGPPHLPRPGLLRPRDEPGVAGRPYRWGLGPAREAVTMSLVALSGLGVFHHHVGRGLVSIVLLSLASAASYGLAAVLQHQAAIRDHPSLLRPDSSSAWRAVRCGSSATPSTAWATSSNSWRCGEDRSPSSNPSSSSVSCSRCRWRHGSSTVVSRPPTWRPRASSPPGWPCSSAWRARGSAIPTRRGWHGPS